MKTNSKTKSLLQKHSAVLKNLKREILRRQTVERKLVTSERHYKQLLVKARNMQEHLRHLSRQIILTQEEERKEISRELHDEIAQTLSGINVHLAALKLSDEMNAKGLRKKIIRTQQIVEKSVNIVHRFARDLRPALLDDLGLIPAIQSYIKDFSQRTQIKVNFKAMPEVEKLNFIKRTVLYRVAQASLTNVAQHAKASVVKLTLQKKSKTIYMAVQDNGKSFKVDRVLFAKKINRLGLLGMRERVEMVGGRFAVESKKGFGTTIKAEIPI